jgi:hypothetical protein
VWIGGLESLDCGKGFCFGASGEVECCVLGEQEAGEMIANSGVAAGYKVDLNAMLVRGECEDDIGSHFASLVRQLLVGKGGRRDEEGLIPEGREFLTHDRSLVFPNVESVVIVIVINSCHRASCIYTPSSV